MDSDMIGRGAPQFDPALTARYADVLVRGCADFRPGDKVFVYIEPAHRQLGVALAEAAYTAGAAWVEVVTRDPYVARARIVHGSDDALGVVTPMIEAALRAAIGEDAIVFHVAGDEDPSLMATLPADRQSTDLQRTLAATAFYREAQSEGRTRFVIAGWPTYAWAERVFPELDPEDAAQALMADLAAFCRVDRDDPVAATRAHTEMLAARSSALAALALDRLELRGPGTHLDIGLPSDALWMHAGVADAYGRRDIANWPSEENFTSPDPARAEGTFACSRPLSFQGRTLENLRGELRDGRLVAAEADDPQALATLLAYLDADEGGRRLGEIALVDGTSPIGLTGRVYHDTLYDENAATHMAFGFGFDGARRPADGSAPSAVNRAGAHVDVMIGSDALDVVGVTRAGDRVPVITAGRFQLGVAPA